MVVGESDGDFTGTSRFEVIRRIGSGGMGVVYEAFDREQSAPVAIKVLRTLEPEALLRFKNEFRVLQDIRHPNLVSLGELFEEGGRWFFTMEMVDGVHFLDYVEDHTGGFFLPSTSNPSPHAIDPAEATTSIETLHPLGGPPSPAPRPKRSRLGIEVDEGRLRVSLAQLARGLHALHRAKKVHRDIKPSNILVTPEGRVVILDFGLVADLSSSLAESYLVGTCWYMAPEQARLKPIEPATDWYSVGVLLYQALTGRLPVQGNAREVLFMKQVQKPLPPGSLVLVPEDLNSLCVDLLEIDPRDRPTGREILRRLGAEESPLLSDFEPELPHFVGRRAELDALREAYASARKGRGATIALYGESGVGKSALTHRFTELLVAEDPQVIVLAGRCYEREAVPYKAVDGVIDALSRALATLDDADLAAVMPFDAGLIGQIFPVMRRLEVVSQAPPIPSGTLDPRALRGRLFAALRDLFTNLAERRPVVVVIDDLQWADADSLALLAELMRLPGAPRLLLVATMRGALRSEGPPSSQTTGPLDPPSTIRAQPIRLQQIEAIFSGDVRKLQIEELPQEDARALVTALLREAGAGSGIDAVTLAEEAGGHPLFIDELVRRKLVIGNDVGPLRLEEALWARIAALDPDARRLLELIVVAGAPLAQDVAARVAEMDFSHFAERVSLLRAAKLVRTMGSRRVDEVEPYHDRVREAVLLHLNPASRRQWHERLARSLEASAQPDPEALAFHWRAAGDRAKAASFATQAAARAEGALAFDRAARLYQLSLDLRKPEHPEEEGRLREKLGDALANAGRGADAASMFLNAASLATMDEALDLQRRAADQLLRSGHIDEAMEAFDRVLAAVGMRLPRSPIAALVALLFRRAQVRLRGLSFHERAEEVIPPEVLTPIDTYWSVAAGLGLVNTIVGSYFQSRGLLLALDAGEPHRIARAFAMEASYASAAGGRDRARTDKLIAATHALAERLDHPYTLAWAAGAEGVAACLNGRWKIGHACCERAEAEFRERCTGVYWEIGTMRWFSQWSQSYLGDLAALSASIPERLREARARGDLYAAIGCSTGLANLVWLAADDPAGARERSREAMGCWSQKTFHVEHWWAMLGDRQIDLYTGDAEAAYQGVLAGWSGLVSSLLYFTAQLTKLEALHLRGRSALMLASQRPGMRGELCREVLLDARRIEGERMPWSTPLATMLRAGVAHLEGDDPRALDLLERAEAGLYAADMGLYAAAVRYRRGQLLGGDEGRALTAAADQWMAGQGIVNRPRMVNLHAPGFSRE